MTNHLGDFPNDPFVSRNLDDNTSWGFFQWSICITLPWWHNILGIFPMTHLYHAIYMTTHLGDFPDDPFVSRYLDDTTSWGFFQWHICITLPRRQHILGIFANDPFVSRYLDDKPSWGFSQWPICITQPRWQHILGIFPMIHLYHATLMTQHLGDFPNDPFVSRYLYDNTSWGFSRWPICITLPRWRTILGIFPMTHLSHATWMTTHLGDFPNGPFVSRYLDDDTSWGFSQWPICITLPRWQNILGIFPMTHLYHAI